VTYITKNTKMQTRETEAKNKMSVTKEYMKYHEEYVEKFGKYRTLVLIQVGSFYEAYATNDQGPDLYALEELTEAAVAHKGQNKEVVDIKNPLMWGFPMVATLKYVGILIENGYRLIMIDQTTPPPHPKREVVAIHSPATYMELAYKPTSNFVANVCVEEILQKGGMQLACIGMSAIDVSTGEVYVHESYSQMNDDKLGLDETIRFLNSISPKEIIINKENMQRLTDDYMIEYLELEGKYYTIKDINKEHTRLIFQKKVLEQAYPERENMTSIVDTLGLSKTIYARKSLVCLMSYVSDHHDDLIKGLKEPVFYLNDTSMILGNDAVNQLNIFYGSRIEMPGSVRYHNLLDVINRASTGMGKRHIKMKLMSPHVDPNILKTTYDIIDVILKDDYYHNIDKYLKKIQDIERFYRKFYLQRLHPSQLVFFITSMKTIEEMFQYIKTNNALAGFVKTGHLRNPLKRMNDTFEKSINIDKARFFTMTNMCDNIFNHGVHPDLDELQSQKGDNNENMNELLVKLDEMIPDVITKTRKVTLEHNKKDGYYYSMSSKRYGILEKKLEQLQVIKLNKMTVNVNEFQVTHNNKCAKVTLPFLKEQTVDMEELDKKLMNMTFDKYIEFMKNIIKDFDRVIKETTDIVTRIDYYVTIAKVTREFNYTRPIIKDEQDGSGYIEATNLRHAIVERIIDHEYVPHSVNIGRDLKGMMIYGLNSAGKSVLMKAIGISVIMAQAGFFVPAQKFVYFPYKSLFTRITGNDNLFRGLSSYSLEMVELNSILKRSNSSTLVIGDEVCRGTEHISGNALVAATLLKLSATKTTFVFATHLHELMELDEIRALNNVKAFHLSVNHDEKTDKLVYDRMLKPGTGERIYGITVAKYIIKDNDFIRKALEIKNILINRDPESSAVSTKKSKYNSSLLVDRCQLCGKKSLIGGQLETHHIGHQKDCENGFVKDKPHIQKNQINNLMVLCDECHDKIHNDEIHVEGYEMTSNGKKVKFSTLNK
jgi:DNA mismatch repair protein MutS